jgi:NAD(P)-dependent dehydrogenase (short-subunit alcohol dehydrogenase family)
VAGKRFRNPKEDAMKVADRVVVVTGGANGIGRALCERFRREGARKVIVADLDRERAEAVARSIDGVGYRCDVAQEAEIFRLIEKTEDRFGPIDLFCSNAGIAAGFDPLSENAAGAPNDAWQRSWAVNVMAHVYAARALVPHMKVRGGGYFLNTVSAAGLLSQVGSAVYSTTKHAAVGFAENLAISHRAHGIRVSILCPQAVDTPMLRSLPPGPQGLDGVMTAEDVAEAAVRGLEQEIFLILPHPQVATYMRNKAENYDRWIRGMARLQKSLRESSAAA